jgi:hypothetical protein
MTSAQFRHDYARFFPDLKRTVRLDFDIDDNHTLQPLITQVKLLASSGSRPIVHLDADAFFAAVEQASDPKLRGKPVAVGGEKRGIIASASYEARKFGVYTPMPTMRARKLCPKLIVLPGDFERYEQFSHWMFGYCYDFTPDVEQTSIDEGYFDLSGVRKSPVEIALTIRRAIGQKLKIIVSEGIATNKLVSAIASKLTKPAAFNEIPPGGEVAFIHPLPNKWLPGVGPKTSARLGDDAQARAKLRELFWSKPSEKTLKLVPSFAMSRLLVASAAILKPCENPGACFDVRCGESLRASVFTLNAAVSRLAWRAAPGPIPIRAGRFRLTASRPAS